MESLCSSNISSAAITSDIWFAHAKEDYFSVVTHFINTDWHLEKKVLGLWLIDASHNSQSISDCVAVVLQDYGILDNVCALTLDNTSANVVTVDKLKPMLKEFMGDLFLHQYCACHIINLIVKDTLVVVKSIIEDFRQKNNIFLNLF